MESKIVMSIGQCMYDHVSIANLIQSLGLQIEKVDIPEEAIKLLKQNKNKYCLVLVNRKIDIDYSDGIELIKKIKNDHELKEIPIMLVSNYREAQEEAIKYGAIYGFGKSELLKKETKEKIMNAIKINV
jgi:two-component system chemotaxis response regulator CheY